MEETMNTKLSIAVLGALIAACSNGGSGNSGPNGNVNSKVSEKAAHTLASQTAMFEMGRSKTGNDSNWMADDLVSSVQSTGSKSEVQQKVNLLNQSVHTTACKVEFAPTGGTVSTQSNQGLQFSPGKMKISGASCPIEVSLDITLLGASGASPCQESQAGMSCKFNAAMKMSYRVLDQKLAAELGLTSGHANMNFEIEQALPIGPSGSTGPSQFDFGMKNKAAFDLKAVDLEGQPYLLSGHQDINFKMVMPAPGPGQTSVPQLFGGAKEDLKYETAGVSSSLLATATINGSSPDEKYYVDGALVTLKAYVLERQKFENSMMSMGPREQQENPSQTSQPAPMPVPGQATPGPVPQPPVPAPQPPVPAPQPPAPIPQPPAPAPQPPAGDRKWICVSEDYSNKNVFVGYGSVEFVAKSKAKQACQAASPNSCSASMTCEEQEANPNSWFCETKNYATGGVYNGSGASKTEASYAARKDCFDASGSSSGSCQTPYSSDCVHL
jgi:hypothetical protein